MSEKDIQRSLDLGIKDAQGAINLESNLDDMIHYYSLKLTGNK